MKILLLLLQILLYAFKVVGVLALLSILGYESIPEGSTKDLIDDNWGWTIGIAGGWLLSLIDDFKPEQKGG